MHIWIQCLINPVHSYERTMYTFVTMLCVRRSIWHTSPSSGFEIAVELRVLEVFLKQLSPSKYDVDSVVHALQQTYPLHLGADVVSAAQVRKHRQSGRSLPRMALLLSSLVLTTCSVEGM